MNPQNPLSLPSKKENAYFHFLRQDHDYPFQCTGTFHYYTSFRGRSPTTCLKPLPVLYPGTGKTVTCQLQTGCHQLPALSGFLFGRNACTARSPLLHRYGIQAHQSHSSASVPRILPKTISDTPRSTCSLLLSCTDYYAHWMLSKITGWKVM